MAKLEIWEYCKYPGGTFETGYVGLMNKYDSISIAVKDLHKFAEDSERYWTSREYEVPKGFAIRYCLEYKSNVLEEVTIDFE